MTTLYNTTNAASGNMFDVVTSANALTVTSLDLNVDSAVPLTIEVYVKSGTWVGSSNDPSAWTLVSSNSGVVSGGQNTPTHVDVTDFVLAANSTTGLYITTTDGIMDYTAGTNVGDVAASNSDLKILNGGGVSYPFSLAATPRIWNGTIYYDVQPNVSATPEPASMTLLGIGGAFGLLGYRLRRRKDEATRTAAA